MRKGSRTLMVPVQRLAVLLCFLTASVCLHAATWAEVPPPGATPHQSLWDVPKDIMPPDPDVKGGSRQFESPTGTVTVKLHEYKEKCLPLPDNFSEATSGAAYIAGTYTQAAGIIKS